MTTKKKVINKTSADLAESLGLNSSVAVEWEVRSSVTKKIIESATKSEITVTDLAKLASTSRSRVTKILKDDTYGISLDVLFRVLGAVGQNVKLSFKKAS
jgi:predicted XRE-type DNA-binding protein